MGRGQTVATGHPHPLRPPSGEHHRSEQHTFASVLPPPTPGPGPLCLSGMVRGRPPGDWCVSALTWPSAPSVLSRGAPTTCPPSPCFTRYLSSDNLHFLVGWVGECSPS